MPEPDTERRKLFATSAAKSMVSAILAASPRVDAFSTWLLGATAGFLVLLVTDIGRTVSVISTGSVKAIIVILVVSAVMGLIQKVIAMRLHLDADMEEAMIRKLAETVKLHSGENVHDPFRYVREHGDVPHMLLLFASAFPKWLEKIIHEMILAERKENLSHLQKHTKRLLWQVALVALQVMSLLVTVVIVLFNL
jgi:hypothetical protein